MSDLYNVTPSLFGVTNNYVTFSDTYGNQYAKFNGLDITLNARPTRDLTIQGGFNGGKTISDNCEIRAKLPEISPLNPYCHVETGLPAAPQVVRLVHASRRSTCRSA